MTHEWTTPPRLYSVLDHEFGFTLDVAATSENTKCKHYFDKEADGLSQSWKTSGYAWCNPPYGNDIGKWVHKALDESRTGSRVVLLIPSRTDTTWWHACVMEGAASEVRLIRGRVRFSGSAINAPFPSAVVIFDGEYHDSPRFSAMERYMEVKT